MRDAAAPPLSGPDTLRIWSGSRTDLHLPWSVVERVAVERTRLPSNVRTLQVGGRAARRGVGRHHRHREAPSPAHGDGCADATVRR